MIADLISELSQITFTAYTLQSIPYLDYLSERNFGITGTIFENRVK